MLVNRNVICQHVGVFGPTGTGKTTTLMKLAEEMQADGITVVFADIKGDVSAMADISPLDDYKQITSNYYKFHNDEGLIYDAKIELHHLNVTEIKGLIEDISDVQTILLYDAFEFQKDVIQNQIDTNEFNETEEVIRKRLSIKSFDDLILFIDGYVESYNIKNKIPYNAPTHRSLVSKIRRINYETFKHVFQESAFDWETFTSPVINVIDFKYIFDIRQQWIYPFYMITLIEKCLKEFDENGGDPRIVFIIDEASTFFGTNYIKERMAQCINVCRSKGIGIIFASQMVTHVPDLILSQLRTFFQHRMNNTQTKQNLDAKRYYKEILGKDYMKVYNLGIGEVLETSSNKVLKIPMPNTFKNNLSPITDYNQWMDDVISLWNVTHKD